MRVWLAQCLCPQRHSILAAADEAEDEAEAEDKLMEILRVQIKRMIGSGTIDPKCGLCGAPAESWGYELGRTRFTSMPEAEPELRQSEREQAVIRRLFGA